jgi:hypothetical protein
MSENLRPVSEVYRPDDSNHHVENDPITGHYETWGYSIGYEFDENDNPVPEGGNTAIFRVTPMGLTEPVLVTKPEDGATFTVNVLNGKGLLIRAKVDGSVERTPLTKGVRVVVSPGEAYSYANTDNDDLVLHDVALPAFKSGDDVEITSSLVPEQIPTPKDGYASCVVNTIEGYRVIELPNAFFDAMSDVMK